MNENRDWQREDGSVDKVVKEEQMEEMQAARKGPQKSDSDWSLK